jgi:hypothetical protein
MHILNKKLRGEKQWIDNEQQLKENRWGTKKI